MVSSSFQLETQDSKLTFYARTLHQCRLDLFCGAVDRADGLPVRSGLREWAHGISERSHAPGSGARLVADGGDNAHRPSVECHLWHGHGHGLDTATLLGTNVFKRPHRPALLGFARYHGIHVNPA